MRVVRCSNSLPLMIPERGTSRSMNPQNMPCTRTIQMIEVLPRCDEWPGAIRETVQNVSRGWLRSWVWIYTSLLQGRVTVVRLFN